MFVLTFVDFEEHSYPVAGTVVVVVTEVPERRPGDDVDLIEPEGVRKSERGEIDGGHHHPRVRLYLLVGRLSEMHRPRHVRGAVCKIINIQPVFFFQYYVCTIFLFTCNIKMFTKLVYTFSLAGKDTGWRIYYVLYWLLMGQVPFEMCRNYRDR